MTASACANSVVTTALMTVKVTAHVGRIMIAGDMVNMVMVKIAENHFPFALFGLPKVPHYIRHVFSGFGDIVGVEKDICPGWKTISPSPAHFLAVTDPPLHVCGGLQCGLLV